MVGIKNTPLITQYLSAKQKVPDAILFFRLGDFYEMFFEDAELGSRILDIQLTSRSKDGIPLCGVPYHSAEPYIAKLLKAGAGIILISSYLPEVYDLSDTLHVFRRGRLVASHDSNRNAEKALHETILTEAIGV